MIKLYYADIRTCLPCRSKLEKTLPPGRAKRVKSCLRDDDKVRCLAAWLLMARILGTRGFLAEDELFTGSNGKPYLKNGPFFNLSHSGFHVLLATGEVELGVDIEEQRADEGPALAHTAFHASELAALPKKNSIQHIYDLWTAKESYLKWLGSGLTRETASFEVKLRGRKGFIAERPELNLRLYDAVPGYSMAVCAASILPQQARLVSIIE